MQRSWWLRLVRLALSGRCDEASVESEPKRQSLPDFVKLQYDVVSRAYQAQVDQLIKLVVLFVTVDGALTGYALSSRNLDAMLFASAVGVVLMIAIHKTYELTVPLLYLGVAIEDKFARDGIDGTVSIYVGRFMGLKYLSDLRACARLEDFESRVRSMRRLPPPYIGSGVRTLVALLALVCMIQAFIASLHIHRTGEIFGMPLKTLFLIRFLSAHNPCAPPDGQRTSVRRPHGELLNVGRNMWI